MSTNAELASKLAGLEIAAGGTVTQQHIDVIASVVAELAPPSVDVAVAADMPYAEVAKIAGAKRRVTVLDTE